MIELIRTTKIIVLLALTLVGIPGALEATSIIKFSPTIQAIRIRLNIAMSLRLSPGEHVEYHSVENLYPNNNPPIRQTFIQYVGDNDLGGSNYVEVPHDFVKRIWPNWTLEIYYMNKQRERCEVCQKKYGCYELEYNEAVITPNHFNRDTKILDMMPVFMH